MIKTIKAAIKHLKQEYRLPASEDDIHKVSGTIYLSTTKTAKLLGVGHHHFCTTYVKPLVNSGVRRIRRGHNKYYCLSEILRRLEKSIEKDMSVLKICKLMTIRKK